MSTVKTSVTFEQNGFFFRAEFCAENMAHLLQNIEKLTAELITHGCNPVDYNNQKGEEKTEKHGVPKCPVHETDMKKSKHNGGYYCSQKLSDGTYCTETKKEK